MKRSLSLISIHHEIGCGLLKELTVSTYKYKTSGNRIGSIYYYMSTLHLLPSPVQLGTYLMITGFLFVNGRWPAAGRQTLMHRDSGPGDNRVPHSTVTTVRARADLGNSAVPV
jgi:hypothetical protein